MPRPASQRRLLVIAITGIGPTPEAGAQAPTGASEAIAVVKEKATAGKTASCFTTEAQPQRGFISTTGLTVLWRQGTVFVGAQRPVLAAQIAVKALTLRQEHWRLRERRPRS